MQMLNKLLIKLEYLLCFHPIKNIASFGLSNKKVLIIRSCRKRLLFSVVFKLIKHFNSIQLDILCHSRFYSEIKTRVKNARFILYPDYLNFTCRDFPKSLLNQICQENYDAIIINVTNRNFTGFNPLFRLVKKIAGKNENKILCYATDRNFYVIPLRIFWRNCVIFGLKGIIIPFIYWSLIKNKVALKLKK
jgi:hypothetical protein